jgi:hypothetical protein
MRLVYDGRSRQPRIEYVGSGRRGGRGTAAAAAAAVVATTFGSAPALPSKVEGAVAEPPVQMDEDGLLTLVRLLRLGQVRWGCLPACLPACLTACHFIRRHFSLLCSSFSSPFCSIALVLLTACSLYPLLPPHIHAAPRQGPAAAAVPQSVCQHADAGGEQAPWLAQHGMAWHGMAWVECVVECQPCAIRAISCTRTTSMLALPSSSPCL